MSDFFLSFNHSDKDIATPFLKSLVAAGYSVHHSSDGIPLDKEWRSSVRQAISGSDTLIIIIPRNGLEDSWLTYEIGLAEALGKKIILMLSEESKALPKEVENQNYNVLSFNTKILHEIVIDKMNVA